jgi:5,5'-dehydrodivanillate O-demethylase
MRRYWHPIAVNAQLDEQSTLAVRLLGEDLVLYRDRGGRIGLVDHRCPHRGMNMIAGVPEQCGLRCPYHGWLFDHTGRCLEQPFEKTADPASTFKDKVRIKAYPVEELGGLIFAYLGPEPRPLLPRWDRLLPEHVVRDVGFAKMPCNWLQIIENSCDPVHHEWLHGYFSNYVLTRLGRPELRRRERIGGQITERPWKHLKIAVDRFEYGLRRRRLIEGETEDGEMWRVGFPVVFPNYIVLRGASGVGASIFHVPIDDTHTLGVYYSTYLPEPGEQPSTLYYRVPSPALDEEDRLPWTLLDNNSGQDGLAFALQGPVNDRTQEHLGVSDQGVISYRKLLTEQLKIAESGQDPINVFRDPADNVSLKLDAPAYGKEGIMRSEMSQKYSPVRKARRKASGRDLTEDPVS